MTIVLKILAWFLAAAVGYATLGPAAQRPHSGLGQSGEHALAFILIGLAFGLAYPQRRLLVVALVVCAVGVLEILQLWAPGRHARLSDFVVDALASSAGFAVAVAMAWLGERTRQRIPETKNPRKQLLARIDRPN